MIKKKVWLFIIHIFLRIIQMIPHERKDADIDVYITI